MSFNATNQKVFRFNPATQAFPPSRLSKVCKHPLRSAWRRFRFPTTSENRKTKSFPFSAFRFPFFANFAKQ